MTEPKSPPETPPGDSTGADSTDAAKLAGQKERASIEIQKDLMDAASKSLIDNLLNNMTTVTYNEFGLYAGDGTTFGQTNVAGRSKWRNRVLNERMGGQGSGSPAAPRESGDYYIWLTPTRTTTDSIDNLSFVPDSDVLNSYFYQDFRPGRKINLRDLEHAQYVWSAEITKKPDEGKELESAKAVIADYLKIVKTAFEKSKLPADTVVDPVTGGGTLDPKEFLQKIKEGQGAIETKVDQTKVNDIHKVSAVNIKTDAAGNTIPKTDQEREREQAANLALPAMNIQMSDAFYEKMKRLKTHIEGLNVKRTVDRFGNNQYRNGGYPVKIEDFDNATNGILDALAPEIERINSQYSKPEPDARLKSKSREKVYTVLKDMLIKTLTSEGPDAEDARIEALQESTRKAINAEREIQKNENRLDHPDANQKPVRAADDNWRFDPQGYLYYQISHVADFRMAQTVSSPFRGIRLAESDPNFIINFVAGARQKRMLDLKTVQAAHLIPKAKFL